MTHFDHDAHACGDEDKPSAIGAIIGAFLGLACFLFALGALWVVLG